MTAPRGVKLVLGLLTNALTKCPGNADDVVMACMVVITNTVTKFPEPHQHEVIAWCRRRLDVLERRDQAGAN